jgi:hypothetical protein
MITANRDASTIIPKVVRDTPTETSLTPLRRGFFFSASRRAATRSSRPGRRRVDVAVSERAVPGERFELPTNGLQNRCSTTELTRQAFETLMNFLFSSRPQAPLATFLLPDVLWPAVYGSAQCLVNASDCIGLHPRQDMGIKVERDSDL